MKADIEIRKQRDKTYWIQSITVEARDLPYTQEQSLAILLGWADPVEVK